MRFILFLCLILALDAQASIDKYLKLSRLVRLDQRNAPEKEQERLSALIPKIVANVRDYGSAESLNLMVAKFVACADPAAYQIYDSKKTLLYGNSEDKVYFVKDNQGTLRYVVKAFTSPELPAGKFLPELSGIVLLQKLQLPHVEPVKPIAVGKCLCAKVRYGLLLESAATC